MNWTMKISCAATLYADGLYLALSRSLNAYDGFDEVSARGKVITLKGEPGTLVHLAAKHAREMELNRVVKILLVPGKSS